MKKKILQYLLKKNGYIAEKSKLVKFKVKIEYKQEHQ